MRTRRPTTRAYTLIEVLTMVIVLGIAAAMVVPVMVQPASLTIQGAARQVMTDILMAQNDAVGSKTQRQVVFNTNDNRYSLTDATGTPVTFTWKPGPYTIDFTKDTRFTGVSLTAASFGGTPTLSFDDLGSPSSGGSVDLVTTGYRYRVSVAPFTGRVTVESIPVTN